MSAYRDPTFEQAHINLERAKRQAAIDAVKPEIDVALMLRLRRKRKRSLAKVMQGKK
ncbi:hypothetical protein [Deefgea piscis]|uniref:hypothetical protein n=1 Tax=Deefgea piscis TaxID=2739061 RepID=UPI001C80FDE3|nr:hypothetical protein [Deefgea piscis]QZA80199.1 hypothetical protein K4H25_11715 [Deefgea piscis]